MVFRFRQPGQLFVVYGGNMINPELLQITTQLCDLLSQIGERFLIYAGCHVILPLYFSF